MASYIDIEPFFLKITGGWISPEAIRTVQVYEGNPALLKLLLVGYESAILLTQADSAYIREYLESRTWQPPQPDSKVVPARPEAKLMELG